NGVHKASFQGAEYKLKSKEELTSFEKMVRDAGSYPYLMNQEELTRLNKDNSLLHRLFTRLMLERVKDWLRIAEERLKGTKISCFILPGNDDDFIIDEAFKDSRFVVNPEGRLIELPEGFTMISTGFSNYTPWRCPRDISEEELKRKVEAMASEVKNFERCIFNFHCPPYGTHLDLAPRLDEQMRPVLGMGGAPEMVHVGSVSIRDAIDRYAPVLSLHGHIHESRSAQRLGRTLLINPGSEYSEGILRGALINLDPGKGVKGYLLTSG
ncbi:MAG: metallophosphoesterase, partial [Nitrososphaerota archaeon]